MKLTEAFLSAELIRALGWTILHSLWQGALVALALSGLLLFLNRYSAQVRYFVSVTALFTLLALSGFTFFSLYNPLPPVSMVVTEQTAGTFSAPDLSVLAPESPAGWSAALPFTHFFSEYFEKHLPLLVTFWFLGLLVMALKMLGGLVYVQRLRHYQTRPLPQKWQQKLAELSAELNLQKPVLLLESLKVNVPMALGYLKPVILVPVGALNGLSEKQVEAILAHELAHICRHDYLFNLLQSFIETIFFFHPAVWWMNACIRAERENCCDDIAMNLCGDPVVFAGALAELEERNFAAGPTMAVALTGRKGSLLSRIKRLADRPKRRAGFSEGFMAACIVMISLSAISLSAMAQLRPDLEEFPAHILNPVLARAEPVQETVKANAGNSESLPAENKASKAASPVPAPESGFAANGYQLSVSVAPNGDGDDIIIVKDRKAKIVELYVNGKKVRKRDMPAFQRIIDERAGMGGKGKRKNQEYASKSEVKQARKALSEMPHVRVIPAPQPKVYVYAAPEAPESLRYGYRYQVPAPPAPPAEFAPIAPVPPVPPLTLAPIRPVEPISPPANAPAAQKKAYEAEMKAYGQELKAYEAERKAYSENRGKEWEEYRKEMENYRQEMETFRKEIREKVIENRVYITDHPADDDRLKEIRERVERRKRTDVGQYEVLEREEAARQREIAAAQRKEAARHREIAARERAKTSELRAKERERAAEARAKAAKERDERLEKLKSELRKDKLIGENDKGFSYRMNSSGLYINDKKQPEAVFEKYRKLFHPGLEKDKSSNYNESINIKED